MNDSLLMVIITSAIFYGTPLLIAALGEVLAERSGVLNLGVEGMMLMGAVVASVISARMGGPEWLVLLVAVLGAIVAGALTALLHAFATITLRVNQTVSGLALTILTGAAGLSSYLANVWALKDPVPHQFTKIDVLGLKDLPIVGPLLFHQTFLTYLSWALVALCSWYLFRTRAGLNLRSVGESPATADAMGLNVIRTRYVHTLVGGGFAGLAGVAFSLSIVPTWVDGMTAGRGWIGITPREASATTDIRVRHAQLRYHTALQGSFERQRAELEVEIEDILQRYRDLRTNDAPGARAALGVPPAPRQ